MAALLILASRSSAKQSIARSNHVPRFALGACPKKDAANGEPIKSLIRLI
jgi:hypothetical protein